jgi:hypothetical protein
VPFVHGWHILQPHSGQVVRIQVDGYCLRCLWQAWTSFGSPEGEKTARDPNKWIKAYQQNHAFGKEVLICYSPQSVRAAKRACILYPCTGKSLCSGREGTHFAGFILAWVSQSTFLIFRFWTTNRSLCLSSHTEHNLVVEEGYEPPTSDRDTPGLFRPQ